MTKRGANRIMQNMNQFRFSNNRMVNEKSDFFQKSNFFGRANNAPEFCSSQVRDLAGRHGTSG